MKHSFLYNFLIETKHFVLLYSEIKSTPLKMYCSIKCNKNCKNTSKYNNSNKVFCDSKLLNQRKRLKLGATDSCYSIAVEDTNSFKQNHCKILFVLE